MFALSCPLSQDGEMGSVKGLMGLLLTSTSVASLLEEHGGWNIRVLYLVWKLSSQSICAKYPCENFLQTFETWTSSLSWNPSEVGIWEPWASLACHSNQPQLAEWLGETALHISRAGPTLLCNVCASWEDLGNWSWCFKAGIKLNIRSVQELRFREARRALSSSEWSVCEFRRGMRTKTQGANQALCETFGSVTVCAFDVWACCSWPRQGKYKRECLSGRFLGKTQSPFPVHQAALGNTHLTSQFFLLCECGCRGAIKTCWRRK